jgi:hypothetical protein
MFSNDTFRMRGPQRGEFGVRVVFNESSRFVVAL